MSVFALTLFLTFEVSTLSAFDASFEYVVLVFIRVTPFVGFVLSVFPHPKTSLLCMANLVALGTLGDVLLLTVVCNVSCLVAFETELLMAIKRVVRVFPAKYAIQPASLVWTLPRHMAKLSTISALDCRIGVYVVPRLLTLQLGKHVVHNGFVIFFLIL